MNIRDFRPKEPGFVFLIDEKITLYYHTINFSPCVSGDLDFSSDNIAKHLLLNVTEGHSEDFYTDLIGEVPNRHQRKILVSNLAQKIPRLTCWFISINELVKFIFDFFSENKIDVKFIDVSAKST